MTSWGQIGEAWFLALQVAFAERLLPFGIEEADDAVGIGRHPGFADVAIAGTAKARGLAVVTQNRKHFEPLTAFGVVVTDLAGGLETIALLSARDVVMNFESRHSGTMSSLPHDRGDGVRPYTAADRVQCLALFDGNVPAFFAISERQAFLSFLEQDAAPWSYMVLERSGRAAACGGFSLEIDGRTAKLCWGMVARTVQGTGLGTALTEARLRAAADMPNVTRIKLDTSQHTQGFYARFGFEVTTITKDGYGPGLDRWDMLLSL